MNWGIKILLIVKDHNLSQLSDERLVLDNGISADIMKYLNDFNLKLQGETSPILAFRTQMKIIESQKL